MPKLNSYRKESTSEEKVKSDKRNEEHKTTEKERITGEKPKVPQTKPAGKFKKAKPDSDSSSESEGCDGPILDEELAASSSSLNVTSVDHNSFLPPSWDDDLGLPDTFPSGKRRHHKRNLVLEGSCNYFFWMEKIAMVSKVG
jgi:hypothetical protein